MGVGGDSDLLDKHRRARRGGGMGNELSFGFLSLPTPKIEEIVGRKIKVVRSLSLGHSIRASNQYLRINMTLIPFSVELSSLQSSLPTWDSGEPVVYEMFYCNNACYILISIKRIGGTILGTLLVWPVKP